MEFRERLYQLRKGRGISQEELANAVGVSRQAVQKWEAGASTPDLNNLSALAGYFSVTLDYLVRGVEPEAPQAAPAVPRPISWQELCRTIGGAYDIASESRSLKERPGDFESMRDHYAYRREYF